MVFFYWLLASPGCRLFWVAHRLAARACKVPIQSIVLLLPSRQRFPCGRAAELLISGSPRRHERMPAHGFRVRATRLRGTATAYCFPERPASREQLCAPACLGAGRDSHSAGLRGRSESAHEQRNNQGASSNRRACLRRAVNRGAEKKEQHGAHNAYSIGK
jgi:hypothetical protein